MVELLAQRGPVQAQAAGGRHALAVMRAQGDLQKRWLDQFEQPFVQILDPLRIAVLMLGPAANQASRSWPRRPEALASVTGAGKCSGPIAPPRATMTACSTELRSSRTLPGQERRQSSSSAAALNRTLGIVRPTGGQKVLGQQRNVLEPFAQRRERDLENGQAKVQVFAEVSPAISPRRSRFVAAMTRNLLLRRLRRADRRDFVLFQHAQQLDLDACGNVAGLVKEYRAAVGQFQQSLPIAGGRR